MNIQSDSNKSIWETVVLDDLDNALLEKVVKFLTSSLPNGDAIWSKEHFIWKIAENPAGHGFLICAVANGEVVGVASITLKRLWYKNKIWVAGETGDTYTHPDYRGGKRKSFATTTGTSTVSSQKSTYLQQSIFGRLVHENTLRALNKDIKIIYGTPNENSRPGYEKRLDYKSHPMQDKFLVRPTVRGIQSSIENDGLIWLLNKSFIFYGMSKIEKLLELISYTYWQKKKERYEITINIIDQATTEIDQLWEHNKGNHEFCLVRDRAYYQHRFFDNPLADYNVFEAKVKGVICGIIVTRIKHDESGRSNCWICDWFVDKTKTDLFAVMLAHVIHEHNIQNNHAFLTWSDSTSAQLNAFYKLGFFLKSYVPIIILQTPEGIGINQSVNILNFTIASSDNI